MTPLLDRLRSETKEAHVQMEALFGMPTSADVQRRWLGHYLGFLEPLEGTWECVIGPGSRIFAGRSKVAWLRDDLVDLGLTPAQVTALPRCTVLPPVENEAQALGAMYVFEGATLGGQYLARHIATEVDPGQARGCRYFRSYGPDVGLQWQRFRAVLSAFSSPETDDVLVASAQNTFAALYTWCSRP